ncbi:MAG TPA: PA2169 family four-helix-bundle protein [Gemmatimonadaceae bacterium]|nr:PA2169 family four-helix-bundle protein [Gemmatimonadaceae bacterium]
MADTTFSDVITTLNDLIETCRDGINGFRTAAEGVTSPIAKEVFLSRVHLIEKGLGDLDAAVTRLGGTPVEHGHPAAPMHRAWINIKSAVTARDDKAILDEVVRGEEVAVQHYRDALAKPLPADVRAMVEMQERGTELNLERARALARIRDAD